MSFISYMCKQKRIHTIAVILGGGSFFCIYSKHAILIDEYQKYFLQKTDKDKKPLPIPPVIMFNFNEILEDFAFTPWNRRYIKPYINKKLDPECTGSSEYKPGFRIGIPEYYSCTSEECIINSGIMIDKKPVNWESADGDKLLKALTLSPQAQKYIIGLNVAFGETHYPTFKALMPPMLVFATFHFGEWLYKKLKLHHRPFVLSVFVYGVLVTFSMFFYLFMDDNLFFLYHKACEDKISEMKVSYILGGIEYYQKVIDRNKAIRKLMKKGEKYYTVGGNEKSIWKASGLPITIKLKLMKERAIEWKEKEELESPPPVNPNPYPTNVF